MPVKHDLSLDLGFSEEDLKALKAQDPHLAALIEKYKEADKNVLKAESGDALGVTDEVLLMLKGKRVKIKDDIVSRLAIQAAR